MAEKDKAVSLAISLKESEWQYISELAEKWGLSRSGAVAVIIRVYRWDNEGGYEQFIKRYMRSCSKGREDSACE